MAKKKTNKRSKKKVCKKGRQPAQPPLLLPTERKEPSVEFSDFSVLLHGEKKIGKTLLANEEEDGGLVFFIQWDAEQKAYPLCEEVCPDFAHFLRVLKALEAYSSKKFPYVRVVTDGVDLLYQACLAWVCQKHSVKHPSEGDYGNVWQAVRDTFTSVIMRLLRLPGGTWFISHSQWKEFKDRKTQTKKERLCLALTSSAEEIVNGLVDATLAVVFDNKERNLLLVGTDSIAAGHRLNVERYTHFLDANGEPLEEVSMGKSPSEAMANLVAAFHNDYTSQKKRRVAKKGGKKKKRR